MAVMRLHLVRHGSPAIDRRMPASTWRLDPEGFGEIDRLRDAGVLPVEGAVWFSSTEPKAMDTAALLTKGLDVPIVGLDELREAQRPADWMSREDFATTVVRSMRDPDVPVRDGWETATAVRDRTFGALGGDVARRAEAARAADVVLVGHGTAWTLLVAALTGRPPDVDAWRSLRIPDHSVIELSMERDDDRATARPSAGRVVIPWGSWTAG